MNLARVSASSGSICSGRMRSIKISLEPSDMASRQVRRIAMASLSSQSWITLFNTYASAPAGTATNASPPTASHLSESPAAAIRCPHHGMAFKNPQEKRGVATTHVHDPAEFLEGIVRERGTQDAQECEEEE